MRVESDSALATSACVRSDSSTAPKRWALAVPRSVTSAPRRCSSMRISARTSSNRVSMTSFFAARSAWTPVVTAVVAVPSCSRLSTADCSSAARTAASRSTPERWAISAIAASMAS